MSEQEEEQQAMDSTDSAASRMTSAAASSSGDEDRNLSVRGIIPALHHDRDSESDLMRIGSLISRFASDPEPSVRAELAEQLPPIACFCLNSANRIPESIYNVTLNILEQLLTDGNSQVRRITQNSLAFMLEKRLVDFSEYKYDVTRTKNVYYVLQTCSLCVYLVVHVM